MSFCRSRDGLLSDVADILLNMIELLSLSVAASSRDDSAPSGNLWNCGGFEKSDMGNKVDGAGEQETSGTTRPVEDTKPPCDSVSSLLENTAELGEAGTETA